ncbi:hypothetical protein IFM89_028876 [Coptis chinensis]|uniref:KOW domain-containing protein n=1 Tax=Coptis chinensis TaxID=261450 RepID=A0A835LJT0_9MAGN|nr:hypothetical protein IFM89_028876 [Coptis chinensis]
MALKGKEIAGTKKRKSENGDKSGSSNERKRKNPGVLQFFDVAAEVDDVEEESESESDDDDRAQVSAGSVDKVDAGQKGKSGFGRTHNLPFLPKEEELSDGELELLLEERYKPGSQHVVYADDKHENKGSGDEGSFMQALDNTTIWRVKCTVGRERRSALCLIQKFVDRKSLGQKLQIASAFSPDHVKGYIYIEAEKEVDVLEACKGLTTLYTSRISPVPKNEFAHLFSIRKTSIEVSPGTWVRVKNGQYRGDLAQVVTFDHAKKRATVKVVPRIDLQALAKKLAGGGTVKQTAVPTARVISSKDLEEFARYIQLKRDRQTGQICQTIDGLKFKDGYLYKKVSMESISYVDVVPSTDELLKFKPYKKDASDDAEWLSHLYGEQRKKRLSECSNGATKGSEGTSGSKKGDQFQLHDLVFFGPKDFGVIIRVESDGFQILKYDEVEGAEVLNVELHEIRNSSSDKKFSTMDRQMKTISLNDTVRVLEGPFTGKEGIVKHICKSTTFIYDESQLENGGYFCAKSQMCENISNSKEVHHETIGDVFGAPGLEDSTGSPKSPELFKKPWEEKENTRDFNSRRNGDRDGAFSVGQTLRIRVGPLKGHLCRVVAIYRSDITVKVDSQTKVLSVKCEHLSEVGMKSNFMTRNDGFGTQGEASGAPTESNGWGGSASLTTGRDRVWFEGNQFTALKFWVFGCNYEVNIEETSLYGNSLNSWPDFTAPEFLVDTSIKNPFDSLVTDDPEKGLDPWGSKATSKKATDSWGNTAGFGGDVGKGLVK